MSGLLKAKLVRSRRWRDVDEDFPRLVYCLLIACVDSWGMMPADKLTLKARLDPFGKHPAEDFTTAVAVLSNAGLVQSWYDQGDPWLRVLGHDKEQNLSRRKGNPTVPIPDIANQIQNIPAQSKTIQAMKGRDLEIEGKEKADCILETLFADFGENEDLIRETIEAIKATRKSGKLADSVVESILGKLKHYAIDKVTAGCRTYLDREYYLQGKREEYLYGIIRGQDFEASKGPKTVQSRKTLPGIG